MVFRNPARANDRLGDLMLASSSARLLTGRYAGAKGKEGVLNRRFRADVFASSPNSSSRFVESGSRHRRSTRVPSRSLCPVVSFGCALRGPVTCRGLPGRQALTCCFDGDSDEFRTEARLPTATLLYVERRRTGRAGSRAALGTLTSQQFHPELRCTRFALAVSVCTTPDGSCSCRVALLSTPKRLRQSAGLYSSRRGEVEARRLGGQDAHQGTKAPEGPKFISDNLGDSSLVPRRSECGKSLWTNGKAEDKSAAVNPNHPGLQNRIQYRVLLSDRATWRSHRPEGRLARQAASNYYSTRRVLAFGTRSPLTAWASRQFGAVSQPAP